jgi:hypothetical protein
MDQRDSYCPYLQSSETTAKGTGLEYTAGKEDPVELDSSVKAVKHCCGVDRWVSERPLRNIWVT